MLQVMIITRFGALWSMAMLKVMTVTRFGAKPCTQNRAHQLLADVKCKFVRFSNARPSAPKAQNGPQVAFVMRNLNLAETKRGR